MIYLKNRTQNKINESPNIMDINEIGIRQKFLTSKMSHSKKVSSFLTFIIALLILMSYYPWPVWSIGPWNMRIVSVLSVSMSFYYFRIKNIKQNSFIAFFYLITVFYILFGGKSGYKVPTHVELSIFLLLLCLPKELYILVLLKFERIITFIFIFGISIYIISYFLKLPSFNIPPLNPSKLGNYQVRIFDLQLIDYTVYNTRKFMSIFDEPGVIGTFLALLISYRKINLNKLRDVILIVGGLLSFSLAFYIVFFINLIYNKTFNIKFYLIFFIIFGVFYFFKPAFINEVLFDRFIIGESISVVDNRTTEDFDLKYKEFVNKGGSSLILGLGPNSITDLSKEIDLNISSYKSTVYRIGIIGVALIIIFYFLSTLKITNSIRGWFFFLVFIMLGWQRPGVLDYYNIFIFFGALNYISLNNNFQRQIKSYK